jgi:adenylate cyclase
MTHRSRSQRLGIVAAFGLFALVWTGYLADIHLTGRATFLDRIEANLLDLRFVVAGHRPAPDKLTIVALDDETVREAGRFPLPRSTLATLVWRLTEAGAGVVALDLLFIDQGSPAEDQALSESLREAGAVIAAAGIFRETPGNRSNDARLVPAHSVIWPIPELRDAAATGLVNIVTDHAGTPRHVPLLLRHEGDLLPSFALGTAARALSTEAVVRDRSVALGSVVTRTDLRLHLPLRFYGPRGAIRTVSARSVLRGEIAREALAGRTVVVGATALGTGDTFATPYDPVLPGVEVLATAIGHLIAGDGLVRDLTVRHVDVAAGLVASLGAVLLIAFLPLSVALTGIGAAMVGWLVVTVFAFGSGLWLSATVPLAALSAPAIACASCRYSLDRLHLRRLTRSEQALRRFQSPVLAEQIASDPDFLVRPEEREIPILFVDLSRFTKLSERLGPQRTRSLLAEYHSVVEREVSAHGGLVLSFMGDGAMIAFGLPRSAPGDARRAVEAALGLVSGVRAWLRQRSEADADDAGWDLDVRVGAHHGPVILSRLGTAAHQHITAAGDSVNVASRLLEVASQQGASAAISIDLLQAAGGVPVSPPVLQTVTIRGREQALQVALWPIATAA